MVGIIDFLAQCKLLGPEARDPQQWYKCTSPRLREASASIKKLIGSPYFEYMKNSKMAEIYCTLVEPPIDGDINPKPTGNYQKIAKCQRLGIQKFFSAIRFTENMGRLMDDQTAHRQVKHRFQVASQPGSGKANLVVPTEKYLETEDDATMQAACGRLGLV